MHALLQKRAATYLGQWTIAPRYAISDKQGHTKFHVACANSSSFLPAPTGTAKALPNIYSVSEAINVLTETLSDCCNRIGIMTHHIPLSLNIQGAEERALVGANQLHSQIKGMTLEMALHNYYSGDTIACALDAGLIGYDLDLWDLTQRPGATRRRADWTTWMLPTSDRTRTAINKLLPQ